MYLVGVDTGGTSSRCAIVDESLTLQGVGIAGPGNYRVAGPDGAKDHIETAIIDALSEASIDPEDTHLVGGYGMGTLDTDRDREIIEGFLGEISFIDEQYVTNDVIAAYYAFSAGDPGLVVIAGTGSMAYGQDGDGQDARSSGWGWLFGDEGSGYDTARHGLQAASKAVDGRGEATMLVDAAKSHFSLDSFEDIFTDVIDEIGHAKDIAGFAKPVAETAAHGDAVAVQIIEDAAQELADAGCAVIEALELAPAPTVSLQGGFGSAEIVATRFETAMFDAYPQASFADPVANPVIGSIAFAMEQRGSPIDRDELARLDGAISDADVI